MGGTIFDIVSASMMQPKDELLPPKKGELQGSRVIDVGSSGRALEALPRYYKNGGAVQPMIDPNQLNSVASDQNLKTDIQDAKEPVEQFLGALDSYEYEYKNPERDGQGRHFSVMAQDLEKAGPVGRSMVIETKQGKMVDYSRGLAVNLAALVQHHQDIKDIQKTIKSLKDKIESRKK